MLENIILSFSYLNGLLVKADFRDVDLRHGELGLVGHSDHSTAGRSASRAAGCSELCAHSRANSHRGESDSHVEIMEKLFSLLVERVDRLRFGYCLPTVAFYIPSHATAGTAEGPKPRLTWFDLCGGRRRRIEITAAAVRHELSVSQSDNSNGTARPSSTVTVQYGTVLVLTPAQGAETGGVRDPIKAKALPGCRSPGAPLEAPQQV